MENKGKGKKKTPKDIRQLQEKPAGFMIVGIGASAGGIQALQEFFRNVPVDSGIAYVVILHLSPDHDSQLARVLQSETPLAVTQVQERTAVTPDQIYVIPPACHLIMEEGYIAVAPNLHMEERRAPVDIFFRTLADQYGPRAIAVILSGTGANGSMGVKRIKERGGAAYVQNPRQAEFNEMPRNAIATELIDEVLNVAEIPSRIIGYRNGTGAAKIIEVNDRRPEPQKALREIFMQLKIRTGHDFSNYKRPTLLRRIVRRINVHNLPDLPAYTAVLHEHPEETHALLKDLLISVTNFFRDKEAFTYLEQHVIPRIFEGKTSEDQIRIWIAGCATGEEAYSVAILCAEQLMGILDAPKVQIFATDIDEAAISVAREGLYSINDAADVSPDRLRQFFTPDGDDFRVRREIREMVLFATHNFLKDPPFSKLDLVCCRNVLIYLNSTAQERVIETFHFALKPKKYLFLGTSESVDSANDLYAILSRDHHIFQTREVSQRNYPVPDSVPQFPSSGTGLLHKIDEPERHNQRISFGELHQRMLEQYAPPSVVINQDYDIVHMTERAGKYLEFSGGEPTQNLLKLIRPEMRLELRSALFQSVQNNVAVEARNIKVNVDSQPLTIDVHVRPVLEEGDTNRGFILVIFKPAEESSELGTTTVMLTSDEPVTKRLEEELIGLKKQLRNSIEQHEYQAEELKASNEELQAMNEELRSAAEELETSKEELQSINEELRTVNQELKVKIEETSITSNNFQNLINSANLGTIFLDRTFAIKLFTPAILDIFNLKSGDYGRPITDITHKLKYNDLLQDAKKVLGKLTAVEQEVTTTDGRYFMMRLLPYRTAEDRINGVVITFFDITTRKASEEALRKSEENYRNGLQQEVEMRTAELNASKEQYSTLVENTPDVITRWNKDLQLVFANKAFKHKPWVSNMNIAGKGFNATDQADEYDPSFMQSLQQAFDTGEIVEYFSSSPAADGELYFYSRLTPERNAAGEVETVLAIARDITEIRKAEQAVNESKELLQATLDSSVNMIQVFEAVRNEQGKIIDFKWVINNATSERINGEVKGESLLQRNPGVIKAGIFDHLIEVTETGIPQQYEKHYTFEQFNGWYHQSVVKLNDGVATSSLDITDRKLAEIALKESKDLLQSILDNSFLTMSVLTAIRDEHNNIIDFEVKLTNVEFDPETGHSELIGKRYEEQFPGIKSSGLFDTMLRVMDTGRSAGLEYCHDHDGFKKWYNCMFVKMDDGLVATNLDITERKQAEALVRKSEERLRMFVSASSDLIYQLSADWTRMYALEGGTFLNKIEGPVDQWMSYYIPADEHQKMQKAIQEAITQKKVFELEHRVILANGEIGWGSTRAVPLLNDQGEILEWFGVVSDISASYRTQQQLQQMAAEQQLEIFRVTLRTQEEERRRISESLHNGLGQILFATRISMSHLTHTNAVQDSANYDKFKLSTEKLLSKAILESRNISHELMPSTLEKFGLGSAISDICKELNDKVMFHCTFNGLDIRLEQYLELAIFRTVQELMLNVVKHSGANMALVMVSISNGNVSVIVRDNGRGITNAKEATQGIGLPSIHSKIKLLNGTVLINSLPKGGTEVTVYIPTGTNN